MRTRETRVTRGVRRGNELSARLLSEVRHVRTVANLSVRAVAEQLDWSHTRYIRFEAGHAAASIQDLATVGSVLGLQLSAGFHPAGEGLRDAGSKGWAGDFGRS